MGHSRLVRVTAIIAVLSFLLMTAAAMAGSAAKHKKPKFKLGEYVVKTSPALIPSTPKIERQVYGVFFKLGERQDRACGGPKSAKTKVECLTTVSPMGEYGVKSITSNASLCASQDGPIGVVGQGWTPRLALPSGGTIKVDKTLTAYGQKTALIKASFHISTSGRFTGTFNETVYVSTGGKSFLGCSTGTLTLKGKWEAAA